MKSRRASRETALQALYQCDAMNDWSAEAVTLFFQCFSAGERELSGQENADYEQFARNLIEGVLQQREILDATIQSASLNWSVARMARVDRNILRVAVYELKFCPDIPFRVSINEAIELAKDYGSNDSPTFVNGVLDKVASLISKEAQQKGPDFSELPRKLAV